MSNAKPFFMHLQPDNQIQIASQQNAKNASRSNIKSGFVGYTRN